MRFSRQPHHGITFGGTPRVDLLPKKQRAALVHERTMPKLLLAIVASAVIAAALWGVGTLPGQLASQRLHVAEAEARTLAIEFEAMGDTTRAMNAIAELSAMRDTLTAGEVLFMNVRDEVVAAMPDGVTLVTLDAQLVGSGATSVDSTDLGALCSAETVSVTVTALVSEAELDARFVDALSDMTGFACVVATRVEGSGEGRRLVVQLALGPDVLAGRFLGGNQ